MGYTIIALAFGLAAVVSALAAYTGHRGWVTDPRKGYRVPARVRSDPELTHRANQLVGTWCLLAAGLALAPPLAVVPAMMSEFRLDASTGLLAATAAYALLVGAVARYPFARIQRL